MDKDKIRELIKEIKSTDNLIGELTLQIAFIDEFKAGMKLVHEGHTKIINDIIKPKP